MFCIKFAEEIIDNAKSRKCSKELQDHLEKCPSCMSEWQRNCLIFVNISQLKITTNSQHFFDKLQKQLTKSPTWMEWLDFWWEYFSYRLESRPLQILWIGLLLGIIVGLPLACWEYAAHQNAQNYLPIWQMSYLPN